MPSDSSSSNKSGAKRPPQPQELSANQTPSFEYLVPISVAVSASSSCSTNSSSSQQQPSINEQPLVEALSWALLHKATGEMEWKRTLDCRAKSAPANKSQDSAHSAALAGALKELEKSLEGKKFMIVACGPFHLRQHLHPIARRLNVELGPPFERYVDLLKEFDRWSASTATKARPEVLPGCAIETPQPLQAKQEHNNSNGQVQQLGAGTRRRLEEILKFLAIGEPVPATRCQCTAATAVSSSNKTGDDNAGKSTRLASGECLRNSNERLLHSAALIIGRLLSEGHRFTGVERIRRRVQVGTCDVSAQDAEQRVVRARGLPWQATEQDIADFFTGLNIGRGGVALCLSRQGRRNGEALIQFESREHRNLALGRHKHFMGPRYVEVYRASGEDFMSMAAGYNNKADKFLSKGAQAIVRMRGLPFSCTAKQVVDFFASPPSAPGASSASTTANNHNQTQAQTGASKGQWRPCEVMGAEEGVLFVRNQDEKPTGDAFVLFSSDEQVKRALTKHHQNIGSRYVELFRSTVFEVQQVLTSVSSATAAANATAQGATVATSNVSQATPQKQSTSQSGSSKSKGNKTQTNQSPVSVKSTQLFPALSSQPIAWHRSEAATYAQVAHSKRQAQQSSPTAEEQDEDKKVQEASVSGMQEQLQEVPPPPTVAEATQDLSSGLARLSLVVSDETETKEVPPPTLSNGDQAAASELVVEAKVQDSDSTQVPPVSPATNETNNLQPSVLSSSRSSPSARSPLSSACSSSVGLSSSASASGSSSAWSAGAHQKSPSTNYNNQHQNYHQPSYHRRHYSGHHSNARPYTSRYTNSSNNHHHHHHHQQQQQHNAYVQHQQSLAYAAAYGMMPPVSHYPSHHQMAPYQVPPMSTASHQPYYHHQQQLQYAPATPMQHQSVPISSTTSTTGAATTTTVATSAATTSVQVPSPTIESAAQPALQPSLYPAATLNLEPHITSERDCIRMRGLPFEAQIEDVISFLGNHSEFVLYQGVHMVYSAQGQPTGEAIIQMRSAQAAAAVAQEAHKRVMVVGKKQRYIEVIPSSIDDLKPTLGYGLAAFAASRAAAAAAAAYGQHPYSPMGHYPAATTASYAPPVAMAVQQQQLVQDGATQQGEAKPAAGSQEACQTDEAEQQQQQHATECQTPESPASDSSASSASSSFSATSSSSSPSEKQNISADPSKHSAANQNHQQQQQQAYVAASAAAQAAAYYPIFYYYPPPQQMLATAPTTGAGSTHYH